MNGTSGGGKYCLQAEEQGRGGPMNGTLGEGRRRRCWGRGMGEGNVHEWDGRYGWAVKNPRPC